MQNRYNLGICEIYHKNIHGYREKSNLYIHNHFILVFYIDVNDLYNDQIVRNNINNMYRSYSYILTSHPTIRNYHKIISDINNLKINIIETIELPSKEIICIIKTIWLKLLQRKWKNIYKKRIMKLKKMKNFSIIVKREIIGKI